MESVPYEIVIYYRYKCAKLFCSECKKERFVRLSRLESDKGKCKSCLLKNKIKINPIINCPKCNILLTPETATIWGKSTKRNSILCKKCYLDLEKEKRLLRKQEAFNLFGGKCSCCGETEIRFLTIDHINNDGKIHRNGNKYFSGDKLYRWISKNYPNLGYDLQVLCWNCNEAKQSYGECPHKKLNNKTPSL